MSPQMKVTSTIKKSLLGGIFLVSLSNCSQPTANNQRDNQVETLGENSGLGKTLANDPIFQIDSARLVQDYMNLSNDRIKENTKKLNQISSQFISESSGIKLIFQGEIFQLNKQNLRLKAQTADSLTYRGSSWDNFKATFDNELGMLEASIAALKIRSEKYPNNQ